MAFSGKSKYKHLQKESLMLNILNNTLKCEIIDDKLKNVSFTYVRLSGDNSFLDVYVDYWDRSKIESVVNWLNNAKGVFRTAVANKTNLYKAPQITFYKDATIDNSLKIEELLDKINKK